MVGPLALATRDESVQPTFGDFEVLGVQFDADESSFHRHGHEAGGPRSDERIENEIARPRGQRDARFHEGGRVRREVSLRVRLGIDVPHRPEVSVVRAALRLGVVVVAFALAEQEHVLVTTRRPVLHTLWGLLSKKASTSCLTKGIRGIPPTKTTPWMSLGLRAA